MRNSWHKRLFYIIVVIFLCAAIGGIGFRLMVSGKGRLFTTGRPLDNIRFPFADSALYQLLILCLSALAAPFLPGFIRRIARGFLNVRSVTFLAAIVLFVLIAGNVISYFVLEHFPRDVDNVARLFQSHTFASGRLFVESPSVAEAFKVPNVVNKDGKMYSKYAPGSALAYALWRRILGFQWGVNPFLGAAMLVILYFTLRKWYDEQTVKLALILLCLSPFFMFMTSSYHSHLPCLFFLSAFVLSLSLGHQSGKWYHFPLSGLWLGMAFITRPYSALLVCLPFIGWYFTRSRPAEAFRRLLFFSVGFAVPLGFLLYYNNALTGHPLRFPFLVANPQEKIGFGNLGHTPLKGARNTLDMLQLLNLNLFGWPCCLLPLILFVLLGKKGRWDIVLLASVLFLIIGYGFYHWIDFSFGPRFYFEMIPYAVLLTARGVIQFPDYIGRIGFGRVNRKYLGNFILCFLLLSFLFAFIFYIPPLTRKYHRDYNFIIQTRVASTAKENRISNALVLMSDPKGFNAYASGFLSNALDFQGNIVYARNLGREKNQTTISAYPDREVFIFEFDREQRKGKFTKYGTP